MKTEFIANGAFTLRLEPETSVEKLILFEMAELSEKGTSVHLVKLGDKYEVIVER
jgi:hypothetical protein